MSRQITLQSNALVSSFAPALLAIALLLLATPARAQEQTQQDTAREMANAVTKSSGHVSGLIGIVQGQAIRVGAVNMADHEIRFQLVLVDAQGKVQLLCNEIVSAGKAVFDDFKHPGGVNRIELFAQVRTANEQDIKQLVPSLEVIEIQNGRTTVAYSGADFFSFRPIFNPPL